MSIYMDLETFITKYGPRCNGDSCDHSPECDTLHEYTRAALAELAALREQVTTARERTLDEVWRHVNADQGEHFASGELAEHLAKLRTPPADPEQARLEREVARAAIAHQHECAAYMDHPYAPNRFEKQMTANRAVHKAEWELYSYLRSRKIECGAT